MRKTATQVLSLIAALCFTIFLGACGGRVSGKIATPEVVICSDGSVIWSPVEHAIYYLYTIDGGEEQYAIECTCSEKLDEGQSVRVKAVSGEESLSDSDYSDPQTYHKEVVDPNHVHSDIDGDGICDKGGESVLEELSIYAVNDLHGKFMDSSSQPGVDEFTTYYKDLVADPAREEILLSSGDMWQGTAESLLNRGQLMTEWMNDVGFVSMTLGNHEFDWGSAVLTPNSALAEFPFLAINVREYGTMPAYCRSSVVVERGSLKIGVIGAIGNCLSSVSSEFRGGLSFLTDDFLTDLVKDEATRLRTEEGCDFIVYSIHDGGSDYSSSGIVNDTAEKLVCRDGGSSYDYYDTALSDGYVDLVFEGHTHQKYIVKDRFGVYHLQGSSENRNLSCADISYNTVTEEFTVSPRHISSTVYAKDSIEDDPIVDELYGKYFPERDLYTPIGTSRTTRGSRTILSKVAELYYQKGIEVWGDEYEIVCGGGFLNARNPYNIYAGDVSYADIATVLPFDNEIVLGEIGGSDLITFLGKRNATSNAYTIYTTIEPAAVQASKTYYIIVDSYTSTYRSNKITEKARLGNATGVTLYARDLLAEFIRSGGWAQ